MWASAKLFFKALSPAVSVDLKDRDLSAASLYSLPQELLDLIILNLAINDGLDIYNLALSSKALFGNQILYSFPVAQLHVKLQFNHPVLFTNFNYFPLVYKAAILEQLFAQRLHNAEKYKHCVVRTSQALQVSQLLTGVSNSRLGRWASKHGYLDVIEVLLSNKDDDGLAQDSVALADSLQWACTTGNLPLVQRLLDQPNTNPAADSDLALRIAAPLGYVNVVQLLLSDPRVSPQADQNNAIRSAAAFGKTDIVRILLRDDRVDPSDANSNAFWAAAEGNHVEMVQLLMDDGRVDIAANNNHALRMAAKNGHARVIALVLSSPRADPTVDDYYALRIASEKAGESSTHAEVVKLLLSDHRIPDHIKERYSPKTLFYFW
ncbi:hypothetical protein BCR33DRAFT_722017 [Rhizoclosmatium globosum]|uniref:Uncharacterized protein n=1 Tax=Rhizoclosmatium globosum TaxID=329046 RepID=A0A1Y2BP30_9FUNG|nr:hypothetical protein BCR33DRAFT_722017 [Rhizoclosmatium globosum]|eukprot:ORY36504.1 hypothetical protein BCR33DRAFT_722017 [Rhizoclosmatium globosum]